MTKTDISAEYIKAKLDCTDRFATIDSKFTGDELAQFIAYRAALRAWTTGALPTEPEFLTLELQK